MNSKIHTAGIFRLVEDVAANGNIKPGMLVEQVATGLQPHSTAGGDGERIYAQEDALQGNVAATGYNAGDFVTAYAEVPGNTGLGLLKAGVLYTKGMKLQSNGDGTLTTRTSTNTIVAVVTVQIDLSPSGSVNTLSQVRYL